MKPLVLYHNNCADGFTAAWCAANSLAECELYGATHGNNPPSLRGRLVYMLDFSYKQPTMDILADEAEAIVVLDHHKSAEAELAHLNRSNVKCIFDMNKSGARLAWEFFCQTKPNDTPWLVKFVEDHDLGRWGYNETRDVMSAVFSYEYSMQNWDMLHSVCESEVRLQRLVAEGSAISRKQSKDISELLQVFQVSDNIGGYVVPVANLPYTFSTEAGRLMSLGHAFAACWYATRNGIEYSLRSQAGAVDVSEIAKIYGGGGHARAAGFRIPHGKTLLDYPIPAPLTPRNS